MEYLKQIQRLNTMLLAEMPEYQPQAQDFPQDTASQRRLLRSLMNVRPPMPLKREFLAIQDNLLSAEREAKGVVEGAALPPVNGCPQIAVWKGDITRLRVDAVPATAALTTLFTRRLASSFGTSAIKSCKPRGTRSPQDGPS